MDSTGIKAEGEGEWNARKHGGPRHRIWRKIHIGIDEETLEVRAVEVTTSNVGDAPMLPELLSQIPTDQTIGSVTAPLSADCYAIAYREWTVPMTPENATMRLRHEALTRSPLCSNQWRTRLASAAQECQAMEALERRCHRP